MARAAHIAGAALLDGLVGHDLVAEVVTLAVLGDELVAEFVVEALGGEVALLLGDPLLEPHMRRDHEFGHGFLLSGFCSIRTHFSRRHARESGHPSARSPGFPLARE